MKRGLKFSVTLTLLIFLTSCSTLNKDVTAGDTSLGSECNTENEAMPNSSSTSGTQICLKTEKGLIWQDFGDMIASKYLDETLPSCVVNRLLNTKLSKPLVEKLTAVAFSYFKDQSLLPIQIDSINEVSVALNMIGIHPCSNGMGEPIGGWGGTVPKNSDAAWLLYVLHKKNRFGDSQVIYIAQIGTEFQVVGGGTSP